MVSLAIYLTGLVLIVVVAWFVAVPFFRQGRDESAPEAPGRSPWQARCDEALEGIRDAELDFHVGKLSEADYRELRRRLEVEAMDAIRHIEEEPRESRVR